MEAFGLQLYTAPASEPVSTTEAKARLKLTGSDYDTDLSQLITDCRIAAEAECQRAFITQTWTLTLRRFPAGREIPIPRPPLASVTHVKYYDTSDAQQTLSSSDYYVVTGLEPGLVALKSSSSWPATMDRPDAVEIRFIAGVAAGSLAPQVKAAILLILADRFENPAGEIAIPPAARRMLDGLETGYQW
jgi:uncharacterized phiE125 gp8 family phage protein